MTLGSTDQLALLPYPDRFLGGAAFTRSRSYPSDSEPDLCLPFEPYEYQRRPSAVALRLQDPFLKCDRNLEWNIDWAVAFIVDRLEQKSNDAAEAFRNIRLRAAALEREDLIEETPYRIFNKLDEVLFAGHLKNAVFLDISSLGSHVSGATYTHSWGTNKDVKRISIALNSDLLKSTTARDIVAILIHHMIHAYFLVACGPQKEDEVDYGRLAHGVHFGKIMLAIKKLSAVHGRELTPLNFGHSSRLGYLADEYSSPRRREAVEHSYREQWYSSHCHCNVQELPQSDVNKWYDKVCKPMFDKPKCVRDPEVQTYNDRRHELETRRRSRLTPSVKSVEFMFKDKPVLVEGKKIEDFLSVKRAFSKTNSRYLKIHKEVSEITFLRFLEFLHSGTYRPDPRPFAAAAVGLGVDRRGPPIIKPQTTTTEVGLLADIQFAKMGILMGFDECKSYALDRMNAYGILYEDPVAPLVEIYKGYEPDSDLKSWARQFLVRTPASSPEYATPSLGLSTMELPNLIKLEGEQSSYRARFLDAVENSGALENDVNKARKELEVKGWYTWPTSPSSSFLTDRIVSYTPPHHLLGGRRASPLLLGAGAGSPIHESWRGVHDLTRSLSSFDLDRIERLDREKRDQFRDLDLREYEKERIKELGKEKLRELEKERENLRCIERERERVREERERFQNAALLERWQEERRRRGWSEKEY